MPAKLILESKLTPARIRKINALVWKNLRRMAERRRAKSSRGRQKTSRNGPLRVFIPTGGVFGEGYTGARLKEDVRSAREKNEGTRRNRESAAMEAEQQKREDAFHQANHSHAACLLACLEAIAHFELPYRLRKRKIELRHNQSASPWMRRHGVSDSEWRAYARHVCEFGSELDDERTSNWYAIEERLRALGFPRDRIDELHEEIVNVRHWAKYHGRKLKLTYKGRAKLDRLRSRPGKPRALGNGKRNAGLPSWLEALTPSQAVEIINQARKQFLTTAEQAVRAGVQNGIKEALSSEDRSGHLRIGKVESIGPGVTGNRKGGRPTGITNDALGKAIRKLYAAGTFEKRPIRWGQIYDRFPMGTNPEQIRARVGRFLRSQKRTKTPPESAA